MPLKILIIIALIVAAACLEGFVISALWGWFVSPTFGLPALSIPLALGISLVLSASRPPSPECEDGKEIERGVRVVLHPILCLLIGFIVKVFFL